MKKIMLSVLLFLALCTLLISCGKEDEAPEGLQVIAISEEDGFEFYGPEGWVVINSKTDSDTYVYGAKMSSFNNISITLTKSDMPEGEFNDENIRAYFEKSCKEFPSDMQLKVQSSPKSKNFGNAEKAYECVYTYTYRGYDFACMQYFIKNKNDFYIFTYTSYADDGNVNDENSDYQKHLEEVKLSIKNFKFTKKSGTEEAKKDYEKDKDGYLLVSDKKLAKFELYLPEEYEVVFSDAYVTAKINDKANIYLGKATSTGVSVKEYWKDRKVDLERIADEVTEIAVNVVNDEKNPKRVVLGDLSSDKVVSYEYTYVIDGVKYHVYQIMGVDTFNGYVFTYTATEDEYAKNLSTVKKILEKVRF